MNRIKQHFWLIGILFLFSLKANTSNTYALPKTTANLADSVYLHLSTVSGNVGDVVSVAIKVGNFVDVSQLTFSVNWNSNYLAFQSTDSFGFSDLSAGNFDILNAATGRLQFSWSPSSAQTAMDSTILFVIHFRIKSYSGLPIPVFILNPTAARNFGAQVKVSAYSGYVKVNNNGNCAGRPAGLTCADAPLLCAADFPYCNTLPRSNPFAQSFGCGSIENYHFIQFEAAEPEITFRVKATNCDGGLAGNGDGIQIRVYETTDCSAFRLKYCRSAQPIGPGGSDTANVTNLAVGSRYYLMIDGQRGDVCDYTISIESGTIGGKPIVTPAQINGASVVCKNSTNNIYTVTGQDEVVAYEWRTSNAGVITSGQGTPSVSVNWGIVSDSICLKVIGNCFESEWACKSVALAPPIENNVSAVICKGSTYTLGGQSFTNEGVFKITLPGASYKGCDSIINLTLTVIDIQVSPTKSGNLTCEVQSINLNGSATVLPNSATLTYEWRDASNTVISNNINTAVSQVGTYTLVAKTSFMGVNCEKSAQITVTKTGNVPSRPELQGDVISCEGKMVIYNIVNAPAGISKYNWFISNGTISSGVGTPSVSVTWGNSSTGKVCVNAENSCGMSDTTCLSIEIGKIPNVTTINGSQTVCPSSVSTYNLGQSTGNVTYQWQVPAGATIKKGQGSSSIEVDWGNSVGGQVCVTPSNNCGSAAQNCITVTVKNAQPDSIAISAPINICPAQTASMSVTPDAGITEYLWTTPTNTTILSGQGTPSVTIRFDSGNEALVLLRIKNSCNLTRQMSRLVKIKSDLPDSLPILGNLSVCSNDTSSFGVSGNVNITNYKWTVPVGATILNGQGSMTIQVIWGTATSGKVELELSNACELKRTVFTENIVIKNATIDAPKIAGYTVNCNNTKATYSVVANPKYTKYKWTIPGNGIILSGQGSPLIEISWNNIGTGDVCLEVENDCRTKAQDCLSVSVKKELDSLAVSSVSETCAGSTVSLSVTADANVTEYVWATPSNATIISGQGTPSVSVRFDSGSEALISLQIKNSCNQTRQMSRLIKIKSDLPTTLSIVGNVTVCSNDTTIYSVNGNSSITGYQWAVPNGATILNGQSTSSIRVAWGTATAGKIQLELTNSCQLKRTVYSENLTIKNASIEKPVIIGSNNNCPNSRTTYSVTANSNYTKYQWVMPTNGTLLTGQGTNTIEVLWDNTGDSDLCLEVENACRAKSTACLPISVKAGIDSLLIMGPHEVCSGATVQFTAQKDPDAISYFWTVPSGSTILSGRGSNVISVKFGSNSGNVVVNPIGGCAQEKSTHRVSIKPNPTASANVSGKTNVCEGDTEKYIAEPVSGVLRYNWRVADGGFIIGNDSINEITVKWATGTGGIVAVKTQNECTESTETSLTVSVNRLPQPQAGVDDSTCGKSYTLRGVSSVGLGTWTVIEKPASATLSIVDVNNPKSEIIVSKSGKYVLRLEEVNSVCSAADTVVLFFRESPQLTLVEDNCNASSTEYILTVNINNGKLPFTFSGGLIGTIQGNTFTSAPIPDAATYALWIKDAYGCVSDTLKGKKTCPCATKAAVLKADNILSICYGETTKIKILQNAVLDANDAFEFLLHEGSVNGVGTVIQKNKTGEFAFDASKMQFGKQYFIHQTVGNEINGSVSPDDRCYRISNGVTVIFKDKISVGLKGDSTICNNATATLVFKTTDKGTFSIVYKNQNQNQTYNANSVKNNSLINVTPSVSSTYLLTQVTDATGCLAEIADSARVNIRPKLTANAGVDKTVCETSTQISATIPPQYGVTWKSLSAAQVVNANNALTEVINLKNGRNIFVLVAKDSVCSTYQIFDSVSIFLPILPQAINLSLDMVAGDTLVSKVVEEAPAGTYSVTRLDSPQEGRFDLFSSGKFSYISNPTFSGIVRFRFMICSDACTGLCDTGEVRILIKPRAIKPTEIIVDVPNAITPNEDGKNDVLMIDNLDKYPENELIIFNRWGDILYKSKPYINDWNGSNQTGNPLPEGTYYYVLRLNINDGKILRGDISILR